MSRNEFIQDVRAAARLLLPADEMGDVRFSAEVVGRQRALAAKWLTPKTVEKYAPDDFGDVAQETQYALQTAVEEFRHFAETVSEDVPITNEQFEKGRSLFQSLTHHVGGIVLAEWTTAVHELISQAESWANERNWTFGRVEKQVRETLLGSYDLPQGHIHTAEGRHFSLDPVARFVVGAEGLVDLCVVPSYDTVMIARNGNWQVHVERGNTDLDVQREAWSEDAFLHAIDWLRQHG